MFLCPVQGHVVLKPQSIALRFSTAPSRLSLLFSTSFANASALYRGQNQNPQNREKRGFRVKNSHFPMRQKFRRFESKNPHFSTGLHKENGDFLTQTAQISGALGNGSFLTPKPSFFPILGTLTPVQGRRVRKTSLFLCAFSLSFRNFF